jgi:hypothetical protein
MKLNLRLWLRQILAESTRRNRSHRHYVRPCIESLEERTLLSGVSPFVQSINRAVPLGPSTSATSVAYTVTFNEVVTGVDLADFSLALTGTVSADLAQVTPVNGAVYTVTVNDIMGTGTLGLNLVDNNTIRDLAGDGLGQPNAPASLLSNTTFASASYSIAVAIADLNGDGKPDLVVANYLSNSVSVLLGNGNGTFQPQSAFATGSGPLSVAAADFNGDGKLDLVVGNYGSQSVSVLLGNGDGTFQSQTAFATGSFPTSVQATDLNGDGKADVVVADLGSNKVSVLLGNGDGTFQSQSVFATGATPRSVAVADFNGDGKPDLVVANDNSRNVSVLLGNGNGTFQSQVTFATGTLPSSVAVADFNGDGKADLVVTNENMLGSVSVLLGNGDGTFQSQTTYHTGMLPSSVAVTDINGDGNADLIISNEGANDISVLLGNGDGTFQHQTTFATASAPYFVAVGDVSGDGRPDAVVATYDSESVSVLLNAGSGSFTGQVYTIVPPPPATHFVISSSSSTATAGAGYVFTVMAEDQFDDVAVAYAGTVAFSSSDQGAFTSLPMPSTLLNGVGVFSATLTTSGIQTLTVTDNNSSGVTGNITGTSDPITVDAATASHFIVNAPASATAGNAIPLTVTAEDPFNNIATGYLGTVAFSSTDVGVLTSLPAPGVLSGGVGVFNATLTTAGNQTLTATDNNSTGNTGILTSTTDLITVSAATASQFVITAPGAASAGSGFSFTVTAEDLFGNVAAGYSGTVTFSSTDAGTLTSLPSPSILVAGAGVFSATLTTAGNQSLTATDNNTSGVTGTLVATSGQIAVNAATASHFVVTAPATATAGSDFAFTITAKDAYGNKDSSYAGTVQFSSSDTAAGTSLPSNGSLQGGVGVFSAILQSSGNQTITASDSANSAIAGTVTVNVVSTVMATHLVVIAPNSVTAGNGFRFTVIAETASNQRLTSYSGNVTFTSTDTRTSTVLPIHGTLISGIGVFCATLTTFGSQTLTATTTNPLPAIICTSGHIIVKPAAASHFDVDTPGTVTAGSSFRFTVTALDRFNNKVTDYSGTVTLTWTDACGKAHQERGRLSNGIGVFSATLVTAGKQWLTASDGDRHLSGKSGLILVQAAAATHFSIKAPESVAAGTPFHFTVIALDRFNNTVTSYNGTVHFTSSDGVAMLPANSTLSGGMGTFTAVLNAKKTSQTLRAADVANAAVNGASKKIEVRGR